MLQPSIIETLSREFADPVYGRSAFPSLFSTGVSDGAVHSAGVSYLLGLGLHLGFEAIAEYPIGTDSTDWTDVGRVLPDSVWFSRETNLPAATFEFERFERGDENKIREKTENLVISAHQSGGSVSLVVFMYWLRSGCAPRSVAPVMAAFQGGFTRRGVQVPSSPCPHMVVKAVMSERSDNKGALLLTSFQLVEVSP